MRSRSGAYLTTGKIDKTRCISGRVYVTERHDTAHFGLGARTKVDKNRNPGANGTVEF